MDVSFDTQSEPSPKRFEIVQRESPPFVIVISEDGNVSEEVSFFLIVFARVPSPRSRRVEELGNDNYVFGFLIILSSDLLELVKDRFGEKFHMLYMIRKCFPQSLVKEMAEILVGIYHLVHGFQHRPYVLYGFWFLMAYLFIGIDGESYVQVAIPNAIGSLRYFRFEFAYVVFDRDLQVVIRKVAYDMLDVDILVRFQDRFLYEEMHYGLVIHERIVVPVFLVIRHCA